MLSGHKGTFKNDGERALFTLSPVIQRLTGKTGQSSAVATCKLHDNWGKGLPARLWPGF